MEPAVLARGLRHDHVPQRPAHKGDRCLKPLASWASRQSSFHGGTPSPLRCSKACLPQVWRSVTAAGRHTVRLGTLHGCPSPCRCLRVPGISRRWPYRPGKYGAGARAPGRSLGGAKPWKCPVRDSGNTCPVTAFTAVPWFSPPVRNSHTQPR